MSSPFFLKPLDFIEGLFYVKIFLHMNRLQRAKFFYSALHFKD